MTSDDAAYFQRRADAATHLASRAIHPRAVQAHYRMASSYLDRLHQPMVQGDEQRQAQ